ncbi:ankyrin repeat and MYND domain-containing protein 1 [Megaptera novaeangliae]
MVLWAGPGAPARTPEGECGSPALLPGSKTRDMEDRYSSISYYEIPNADNSENQVEEGGSVPAAAGTPESSMLGTKRFILEAPEGEKEEPEGPLREQDLKEAYIELIRGVQEWQDGCVYPGELGLDVKLGCGEFSWPTGEVTSSPLLPRFSQPSELAPCRWLKRKGTGLPEGLDLDEQGQRARPTPEARPLGGCSPHCRLPPTPTPWCGSPNGVVSSPAQSGRPAPGWLLGHGPCFLFPVAPHWTQGRPRGSGPRAQVTGASRRPTWLPGRIPFFKFCYECGRCIGVRLTPCTRCYGILTCSEYCETKAWSDFHRRDCHSLVAIGRIHPALFTREPLQQRGNEPQKSATLKLPRKSRCLRSTYSHERASGRPPACTGLREELGQQERGPPQDSRRGGRLSTQLLPGSCPGRPELRPRPSRSCDPCRTPSVGRHSPPRVGCLVSPPTPGWGPCSLHSRGPGSWLLVLQCSRAPGDRGALQNV